MNQVASWAAGKPVSVWCESDAVAWDTMTRSMRGAPGAGIAGFTLYASPVVYVGPPSCANLNYGITDPRLALGLNTLLHESAHQRGFHDEDLAECAARVLIYSALHDYYGVEWFSPTMHNLVAQALAESLTLPAVYQHGCDRI
jgi:hypothetical protein